MYFFSKKIEITHYLLACICNPTSICCMHLPRMSEKAETSEGLFGRDRVNQRGNGNAKEGAAV